MQDEDPYVGRIHDLGVDLIDCVLNVVDVPKGVFTVDHVTRHDGGAVTINFSGHDEDNGSKRYSGIVTYRDGKWNGEWAYNSDVPTVIDFHVYYTIDPVSSQLTLIIDSPMNDDRAVGPMISQFGPAYWSRHGNAMDFAMSVARERVGRYKSPQNAVKVYIWDDAEQCWYSEDELGYGPPWTSQ
jgi:hypothetical protein